MRFSNILKACVKKGLTRKTKLISSFTRFKTSPKLVGPSLQVTSGRETSGDVNLGDKSPELYAVVN